MTEVWIVQPYVPSYRVPFFEGLSAALGDSGTTLRVVAGRPDAVQAKRGDSITPPWLTQADDKVLHAFGRSVTLTRTRRHWRKADAVIVPHMGSSFDALSALGRKSGLKVGVWGHIASYTSDPNPIDQAIERWQLRRADHVFAYTPGGARYASSMGVRPDKLTVVMNAVETAELWSAIQSVDHYALTEFRAAKSIRAQKYFAYIGGLDPSKRVDLLASSLSELHARGSDIHIVVGGSGVQRDQLLPAVQRGQVTMLGHVTGKEKALLLAGSHGLVNPGRVGLVAVEALVSSRPIITTDWPYHAPEAEYLEEGSSRFSSSGNASDYADLLQQMWTRVSPSIAANLTATGVPTLAQMVENFAAGISRLLGTR